MKQKVEVFMCKYCNIGFKLSETKETFKTHMRTEHGIKKCFECGMCHEKYNYNCDLKDHVDSTHLGIKAYKCEVCDKDFNSHSNLFAHKNAMHNEGKSFKCEKCAKVFPRKASLQRHLMFVHISVIRMMVRCDIIAMITTGPR